MESHVTINIIYALGYKPHLLLLLLLLVYIYIKRTHLSRLGNLCMQ